MSEDRAGEPTRLFGLSDIGRAYGVTREAARQWAAGGRLPPPDFVCEHGDGRRALLWRVLPSRPGKP